MTPVVKILIAAIGIFQVSFAFADEEIFNPFTSTSSVFPKYGAPYDGKAFSVSYFTQKLNHLDVFDDRTWQQRYFMTNSSYTSGTPIFLVLGGEWEIDPRHIENGFLAELEATFGAFTIYLEHRFYGNSIPTSDISTENLAYLTLDQALEDTAYFTQSMKRDLGLDGKWFVMGASYSGALAAWARASHPHLYHAAYASGAPAVAIVDIPEYFEVVNQALLEADPNCPTVITAAMAELTELIANNQAANITELFNLVEEIDLSVEDDVTFLYFSIAQIFGALVQGARTGTNAFLCNTLVNGQDAPLDTLAALIRLATVSFPLSTDASKFVEKYRNQVEPNDDITRPWVYHACNELGWINSLSSENQPFGQLVSLEYRLKFCTEVYGPEFNREHLDAGIERINLQHGGYSPDVSRVIYTVGTLDPISVMQMNQDIFPESPVVFIEGASHCIDIIDPSKPDDSDSLTVRVVVYSMRLV